MKVGRGSRIVKMNISRRGVEKSRERSVEYLAIGCKVATTFIIFKMCRREGI
jgi:hypothetical protein